MTDQYQCLDVIDITDRGLAYGDGLFETIAYVNGQLHHWSLHWQRLVLGCERLSIARPDESFLLQQIELKISQEINLPEHTNKVIKLIITRGSGGRGYQFADVIKPSLIVMVIAWPERPLAHYQVGIDVLLSQVCLGNQVALAGIKHLNRLEQVLARNEFSDEDFQEGLMLQCVDNVALFDRLMVEGISSNLFFVIEGRLLTPKIDKSGVQGTIRQAIFSLAEQLSISIEEGDYPLSLLKNASEVFFTNSLMGIVPMASLKVDDQTFWSFGQNKQHVAAKLSRQINTALNRPEISG